ncbi:MAG: hypothetical protein E6Q84_03120 [Thiothrix sp.]|nr:MAG: hypothetical protein E6Q84_03120 [Thiothrix sp.]
MPPSNIHVMLSHANCGACGVPSGCRSFLPRLSL